MFYSNINLYEFPTYVDIRLVKTLITITYVQYAYSSKLQLVYDI